VDINPGTHDINGYELSSYEYVILCRIVCSTMLSHFVCRVKESKSSGVAPDRVIDLQVSWEAFCQSSGRSYLYFV
jgi:hypothetical protein